MITRILPTPKETGKTRTEFAHFLKSVDLHNEIIVQVYRERPNSKASVSISNFETRPYRSKYEAQQVYQFCFVNIANREDRSTCTLGDSFDEAQDKFIDRVVELVEGKSRKANDTFIREYYVVNSYVDAVEIYNQTLDK